MTTRAKRAEYFGSDGSTTSLTAGVTGSGPSEESCVSIKMRGATEWKGQPAFDPSELPSMFCEVLATFKNQGWLFDEPGVFSLAWRQHDMLALDDKMRPLIPILTWECDVATAEVEELQKLGAEEVVGPIEARFILPKLLWAIKQDPTLKDKIHYVMTTGDYIVGILTGRFYLSTSDGLSNGLLNQESKDLARGVIAAAGLNPDWFSEVVQSGKTIGPVISISARGIQQGWEAVVNTLMDWQAVAGLGDNHAGGVGCGLSDDITIVVSAGSSGTVVEQCSPIAKLIGLALCFEYYLERLLLRMLAECALSYGRFLRKFCQGKKHEELNQLALKANPENLLRVRQKRVGKDWEEIYPDGWDSLSLGEKVASTQCSILLELLLLVKEQLKEVKQPPRPISRFVLTGGMSQSEYFRQMFREAISRLNPSYQAFASSRTGQLAFQAATLGAIVNAMLGGGKYSSLAEATAEQCPISPIPVDESVKLPKFMCDELKLTS